MNAIASLPDDRVVPLPNRFAPRGKPGLASVGHRLSELVATLGAEPDAGSEMQTVRLTRVRRGTHLLYEGAAPQLLHVVRSGWFKCTQTAMDGYEHVFGFFGRGDVLGFEGLATQRLPCSAEALEDGSVFTLALHDLDVLRRLSPSLDRALQRVLAAQLMRATEAADMMAAVASEVRLARFLVWMSHRMAERGESPRRFLLRMTRREIASLLGVAHETISRGLGLLAERGQVRVDFREIEIMDMEGLKASTVCTRRDLAPPSLMRSGPACAAAPGQGAAPPAA